MTSVASLDYGSGNLRSAERALERAGADVTGTADPDTVLAAAGLVVPGVGDYAACMEGLRRVQGGRLIGSRLAGGRPVLGICVGMQILFDGEAYMMTGLLDQTKINITAGDSGGELDSGGQDGVSTRSRVCTERS